VPPSFPIFSGKNAEAREAILHGLLIAALIIAGLYFGREVLLPLAVAILLSFVLTPPLLLLRKLKVPRVVGVSLVVTLAFSVIILLGWLLSQQITQLAENLPTYRSALIEKMSALRTSAGSFPALEKASEAIEDLGRELAQPNAEPASEATESETADKPVVVQVEEPPPAKIEVLRTVAGLILSPLATAGIVLIFVVFILLQREELRDRSIRLFASSDVQRATLAINEAAGRLSKYFLSQLLINSAYGVFIAGALWLLGVPGAIAWGILAALMRFVPYIGSFIAATPPLLLAAVVEPSWSTFFVTGVLYLVSELAMGQVVEPLVYGHGTGLSPLAVIAAAVFWTWIWGPLGLLLAVPFTVCLVVLGRHVEGLRFLEVMLGDEPALTQEQTFYQRALAGDSAEITYQAEIVLKDEPLEDYLDDVALKGLQLAERDRERGTLDEENLKRVCGAVDELMENLAEFEPRRWFRGILAKKPRVETEDQTGLASLASIEEEEEERLPVLEPDELRAGWDEPNAILCLGTRTSLDDAAAIMLSGLLRKHGLKAQTIHHGAIADGRIISLEASVKLVCLSGLSLGLSTAHIRYLVRRLRRILPHAKIVIGFWGETATPALKKLGEVAGPDAYATSLHDAAEIIIDFARAEQPASQSEPTKEDAKEVVSGNAALGLA
jgi:predicted PurR-regulated permease PerM